MSKTETYESVAQKLIPGPRDEDWRYADLSLIRGKGLPMAANSVAGNVPAQITSWPQVVIANGKIISAPKGLKGVDICFKIETNHDKPDHPLERINSVFANTGLEITISDIFEGLEIVFIEDGDIDGARHIKNRIVLEDGAKANILLRTIGRQKSSWLNMVTEVNIGKSANLLVAQDFDSTGKTLISSLTRATVDAGSSFNCFGFGVGVPSLRNEIEVALWGKKARAVIKGGMLAGKDEVVDFVTRIFHKLPEAESSQTIRGVAGKAGQVAFQGRVVVEKDAQKTEAHQSCQNLILERTGEANVKPELLIFADDVVCSHGATVGEIDETALFYMMQRGIPEGEAKALLVRAFLGDATEGLGDETLVTYFEKKIETWMQYNLVERTK